MQVICWFLLSLTSLISGQQVFEDELRAEIELYNEEAVIFCNENTLAKWNVQTNVGVAELEAIQNAVAIRYAEFRNGYFSRWLSINPEEIQDEQLRRQLTSLQNIGTSALEETDLARFTTIVNSMSATYNRAVICPLDNTFCNLEGTDILKLEPDIISIMARSENYEDLLYVWTEWHANSGRIMRQDYGEYVALLQQVAELNGHNDAAEWWQSSYEDFDFNTIDAMWNQVKPLYNELHTYVRRKLTGIYGERMEQFGPYIPAHLTGNMWAQSWTNIYDRVKPFDIDNLGKVTENMLANGYTVTQMFEEADEFYKGMGLFDNSMSYDTSKAVIENPVDRTIACHASAWDFCKDNDFRIKMCTDVDIEDFKVVLHEMGHIQYFIQYALQPLQLREGANPAFHEAIGDALVLSFANPKHLAKIGLVEAEESREADLNGLFLMALERIAFLPFGLLIDKWRWEVFNGTIGPDQWNQRWWELRREYQQIVPPDGERSEQFFDPGAKYHVPADSQYIGYFFARFLQFQIYKSMCIAAGEYAPNDPNSQPLHKCVFDGNLDAGKILSDGLALGSSRHWREILEVMTGDTEINAEAMMEYFRPLHEFLLQENQRAAEEPMRVLLQQYNVDASAFCNRRQKAEWNSITDLESAEKAAEFSEAIQESAAYAKAQFAEHFEGVSHTEFVDIRLQRQLMYLSKLGTDILDSVRLTELRNVTASMELIYNSAKVCPYDNLNCDLATDGLALNPGIETRMAESNDYDELLYIWKEWHEKSGRLMQTDYQRYMAISNEAALANGFSDTGDMWRFDYEYDDLRASMMGLWEVVKPLYDELHTYVLHELYTLYGPEKIDINNPLIPAHLLGNMWAQSWVNLYERIKPYPAASDIDVTSQMLEQGYTPLRMFQIADRFYMDLGLNSSEMSYTGLSIIEQPTDRLIVCHASAWDFCDGEDFRIKQCTLVNMNHFVTVHHEMGHIQYYIQYKDQPLPFRRGANPGFHEAVGDVIALSVATPQHLQKIGLLENYADTVEDNINALFKMALQRVAFLPFGFLIDMYRWDLFSETVPQDEWNSHWESLRETYQKVESPVPRSSQDFDAGAKFHVASGYQYINYFIAHILEFQLHKSLCTRAGQYDPVNPELMPLHKCDIDGSAAAGDTLRAGLSLGLSQHWSETLEIMTGETELKADALLEYFAPLRQFLRDANDNWVVPEVLTDPPETEAPTTDEPTTVEPTTVEPTTVEPTTVEATTVEPTTVEPTTVTTTTIATTTDPPTTVAPTTIAPTTVALITDPPETDPPETDPPETDPPETDPPTTVAPTTDAPTTDAPSTDAPTTIAPPPATPFPGNEDEPPPLLPIILGTIFGGAVVIGVVVAVIYYYCKKTSLAASARLIQKTV